MNSIGNCGEKTSSVTGLDERERERVCCSYLYGNECEPPETQKCNDKNICHLFRAYSLLDSMLSAFHMFLAVIL